MYICEEYGKTFLSSSYLEHINAHSEDKLYNCIVYNKSFVNKRNLKKQNDLHTRNKSYVCDFCVKTFKRKVMLRRNIDRFAYAP